MADAAAVAAAKATQRGIRADELLGILFSSPLYVTALTEANTPTGVLLRQATVVFVHAVWEYTNDGEDTQSIRLTVGASMQAIFAIMRQRGMVAILQSLSVSGFLSLFPNEAQLDNDIAEFFMLRSQNAVKEINIRAFEFLSKTSLATIYVDPPASHWTIGALSSNAYLIYDDSLKKTDENLSPAMARIFDNVFPVYPGNSETPDTLSIRAWSSMDSRLRELRHMLAPIAMLIRSVACLSGMPASRFPPLLGEICPSFDKLLSLTGSELANSVLDSNSEIILKIYTAYQDCNNVANGQRERENAEQTLIDLVTRGGEDKVKNAILWTLAQTRMRMQQPVAQQASYTIIDICMDDRANKNLPGPDAADTFTNGRVLFAQAVSWRMITHRREQYLNPSYKHAYILSNSAEQQRDHALEMVVEYQNERILRMREAEARALPIITRVPAQLDYQPDLPPRVANPDLYSKTYDFMYELVREYHLDGLFLFRGNRAIHPGLSHPDTHALLAFTMLRRRGIMKTNNDRRDALRQYLAFMQRNFAPVYDLDANPEIAQFAALIPEEYTHLLLTMINAITVDVGANNPLTPAEIRTNVETTISYYTARINGIAIENESARWGLVKGAIDTMWHTNAPGKVSSDIRISVLYAHVTNMLSEPGYVEYMFFGADVFGFIEKLRHLVHPELRPYVYGQEDTQAAFARVGMVVRAMREVARSILNDTSKDFVAYNTLNNKVAEYMSNYELYLDQARRKALTPAPNFTPLPPNPFEPI